MEVDQQLIKMLGEENKMRVDPQLFQQSMNALLGDNNRQNIERFDQTKRQLDFMKMQIKYPQLLRGSFIVNEDVDDQQALGRDEARRIFLDMNKLEKKMCKWILELERKGLSEEERLKKNSICQIYTVDYCLIKHKVTN